MQTTMATARLSRVSAVTAGEPPVAGVLPVAGELPVAKVMVRLRLVVADPLTTVENINELEVTPDGGALTLNGIHCLPPSTLYSIA